MSVVNKLIPLEFPLHGVRLIEASAGTGKTFTIAALYVRLVLGHGTAELGLSRELLPPDILVVTFTDASTKELRDRIRARLSSAALYFRKQSEEADEFLTNLRLEFAETEWPSCAHRLELAANWMDESAVYTIHGWCNRMLKQHAFDSGSLFHQELNNDDTELLLQVVRDYWRTHFYSISTTECYGVFKAVKSPAALAKKIRNLLAETEALPLDESLDVSSESKQWETWELERQSLENIARQAWFNDLQVISTVFTEAAEGDWLNQRSYPNSSIQTKLAEINQWAKGVSIAAMKDIAKFSQANLIKALKKDFKVKQADKFELSAFKAIDDLVTHTDQENNFSQQLIPHAIQWIRQQYANEKQRLAQITYDDMLTGLDAALQGERGEHLASVIRGQYPIAMIDEFQDTDPVQYRIFSTLYPAQQSEGIGCFMIGDPKQAIYSFRGADIFTYLKAHQATTGNHYTLDTNYRSTQGLVTAVNQVFLQADQTLETGAFQFKSGEANPLPFVDVKAQGRKKQWQVNGQAPTPFTFWCLESNEAISFTDYQKNLAEATASEIVSLLNSAQQDQTGFVADDGQLEPLKPGHIAILVRTGKEAKVMRKALAKRHLLSVYLSERDSIYATTEAKDVLIWLKAFAEPRSERKVRAALSTATFGFTYQQLHHFAVDENSWETQLERFLGYQQRWQQDGILPALRQLINDYNLHGQALEPQEGERSLTNLLHLAELLQQASSQLDGEQALIRHLAEAIEDAADQSGEEAILRLESDANLIQIITIHKSKGLEYPLVFLPFIASFREPKGDYYRFHDQDQKLRIDLDKADDSKAAANAERLQEDLRLLYVALTRAQYACWLGLAPIKFGNAKACQLDKSAIGYLMNWQGGEAANQLKDKLLAVKAECQQISIESLPMANDAVYTPVAEAVLTENIAVSKTKVADNWWIASYSALAISEKQAAVSVSVLVSQEPESSAESAPEDDNELEQGGYIQANALAGVHQLPRGAGPGVLVHGLLEHLGRSGFSEIADNASKKQYAVRTLFKHAAWQDKHAILESALDTWLTMPLLADDHDFCLAKLEQGHYQVELEFLIGADELNGVDVQQLDALVTQSTFAGQSRPAALPNKITGLLKGFIDLVFVHNGRYYVADYKFNHLGDHLADYAPNQLQAAMLSKRYDLQMVLYLLALHRLLKARLGRDYDYDQHIGGGLYLFLRGAEHESHGLVYERPKPELIEKLDQLFKGDAI
jgi:exodeoxyribonuclease V beta subunit